ncbi:MAG: PTS transporter subunit EIIC, partial [Armatimonadota bacterium]
SYKLDGMSTGILSGLCFVLTQKPQITQIDGKMVWYLKMDYLGGSGLFAAIICAFFAVEITRFFNKDKFKIKMPEGVPPSVVTAFTALLPAVIIMTITWLVAHVFDIDIVGGILKLFSPLVYLGDTVWAVIIINIVLGLIWLGGIHGASVVNAVFITIWMQYFDANTAAQAAGQPLPYITTLPFYQWFVWIGGSGATLGLIFLMLLSKSKHIKNIGKISLIPGVCNINEPIIYGLPITMNPILALPFLFVPVITGVISYYALHFNLIHRLCSMPPWTLPAPIGVFFATLFDWRGIVLVFINIIIATILYYPFLKEYEKTLLEKEVAENDGN